MYLFTSLVSVLSALVLSFSAQAEEVRPTNSEGEIEWHKNYSTVKPDGRIVETSPLGDRLYHKQQYLLRGDKVIPIDSIGNPQYHKQQSQVFPKSTSKK